MDIFRLRHNPTVEFRLDSYSVSGPRYALTVELGLHG